MGYNELRIEKLEDDAGNLLFFLFFFTLTEKMKRSKYPISFVGVCLMAVFASAAVTSLPSGLPLVDVFSFGEGGYYCMKIPYLFTTQSGTLLAFAEARHVTCYDWAGTDLVWKRSTDNGATWSKLRVVYSNTSITHNIVNVIGNAAPLQLSANGRILLPFCRNNNETWQTHSDDDGLSWAPPERVIGGTRPGWAWIGLGPPGGMQMLSGRLVVASYHSYVPKTDGTITRSHLMISDDPYGHPSSWRIGAVAPGIEWTNECQVTELERLPLVQTSDRELRWWGHVGGAVLYQHHGAA